MPKLWPEAEVLRSGKGLRSSPWPRRVLLPAPYPWRDKAVAWEGWETSRVLSLALHLLCDRSYRVQLQRGAGRGQYGKARMLKLGWGRPAQEVPWAPALLGDLGHWDWFQEPSRSRTSPPGGRRSQEMMTGTLDSQLREYSRFLLLRKLRLPGGLRALGAVAGAGQWR